MITRLGLVVLVLLVSVVVLAQDLIFSDDFEARGTGAWSATVPPLDELGVVTGAIQVNHFGWRPGDSKVAIVLGLTGEAFAAGRTLVDVREGRRAVVVCLEAERSVREGREASANDAPFAAKLGVAERGETGIACFDAWYHPVKALVVNP